MTLDQFRAYFGHGDSFRIEKAKAKRQMRSFKLRGHHKVGTWLRFVKPPLGNKPEHI